MSIILPRTIGSDLIKFELDPRPEKNQNYI